MPRSFCVQASLLDQVGVDLLTPLHWAARKGHEEVRRPYSYVSAYYVYVARYPLISDT